tara:strand:- start:153 stop:809 length:657 start_codon:yes stop_codon:yes gene_type:complete
MFQEESVLRNVYRLRGIFASLFLAIAVYATLQYLVLKIGPFLSGLKEFYWVPDLIPLLISVTAFFIDIRRRQKWIRNASLQGLREMPYMDFRLLIAEALKREGYSVEERSGFDSDHGIDLTLFRDNYRVAAMCKHWERKEIDSSQVQELYEKMILDGSDVALFITAGNFTEEARRVARGKPVVLADGKALLELVQPLQADSGFESTRYLRRASLDPTF